MTLILLDILTGGVDDFDNYLPSVVDVTLAVVTVEVVTEK